MKNDNEIFKTLFGIEQDSIKETCIVTPFYSKAVIEELKVKDISNGLIYTTGYSDKFSFIITKMGAGFVGDAVLYLKNTKCKNIIFFGSCGAVDKTLKIGDAVLVDKAYSQDSFVNMLNKKNITECYHPDKELIQKYSLTLPKANCLSVASLKMEEEYLSESGKSDIGIVDMEAAAFLAAAEHSSLKAVCLLYVTDILKTNPYYETFKKENMPALSNIARNAAKIFADILPAK
jgi:purine-nucleoside phosphorylase